MIEPNGLYTSLPTLMAIRQQLQSAIPNRLFQKHPQSGDKVQNRLGNGMQYAQSRAYQTGDDLRLIDWRMTARMQKPYTKQHHLESHQPCTVILDQSATMFFGSSQISKSALAAYVAAYIGWQQHHERQSCELFICQENTQKRLAFGPSLSQLTQTLSTMNQINQALAISEPGIQSSWQNWLESKAATTLKRQHIIIISDFLRCDEKQLSTLKQLGSRHQLLCIQLYDSLEQQLPAGQWHIKHSKTADHTSVIQAHENQEASAVSLCQKNLGRLAHKHRLSHLSFCTQQSWADISTQLHHHLSVQQSLQGLI